jgi:prevent-host-death family protein
MDTWPLQDAKNRFSEVVRRARDDGPQVVTKRGVETVVVMSHEDYLQLLKPDRSLVELMRQSPLVGARFDLDRRRDKPREVEL